MSEFKFPLSVIVPIYNVEAFIERCIFSLFNQTLRDIEFIFIDDCSTDKSLFLLEKTLERYPERRNDVQIIRNDCNKGVAAVRNIGLRSARGEYIGWVDSDDWIEPEMYSLLYQRAIESCCDIVWCDYYNSYPDHEDRQFQSCNPNNIDYIRSLLLGKLHGGLWLTIIKKALFVNNSILFPEGKNVMEDKNVLIKLACYATQISYIPIPYYHYVKYNNSSLSSCWDDDLSIEHMAKSNLDDVCSFLQRVVLGYDFTDDIAYGKLVFKKGYLNYPHMDSFRKWKSLYNEANEYVLTCPNTTLKQRVLGWLIEHDYNLPIKFWIKLKTRKRKR